MHMDVTLVNYGQKSVWAINFDSNHAISETCLEFERGSNIYLMIVLKKWSKMGERNYDR